MNCEACNQPFNLTIRLPLILPCCYSTICKECVINLAGGPQQPLTFCPSNNDCGKQNFNQDHLKSNKQLEKLLQQSLGIFCDKHPQSQAEFYCKDHHTMVCTACAITTHQGHQCQAIEKQSLINLNNKILEFLRIERDRICDLINEFENYQQNEKHFSSEQYLNLIKDSQITLSLRLNEEQLTQIQFPSLQINIKQQFEEENKQEDLPNQIDIENSKLIKQDDYELLKEYLNTKQLTLKLLYRGSLHGFTVNQFQERCYNQGPTLVVALSEHNQLFGGYTSISWDNKKFGQEDANAFLFQLTKKFKLTQYQNQHSAVYHSELNGPCFGGAHPGGYDLGLGIGKDFNEDKSCWSSISKINSNTYSLPNVIKEDQVKAAKFLGGSCLFKLIEIEIFMVIM